MNDLLNLNRFIEAQSRSYDAALNEIKSGHKTGCWMWYIFPQYKGLGQSSISQKYAIVGSPYFSTTSELSFKVNHSFV